MHVDKDNLTAKFWLDPEVSLADNHGYDRRELRIIERLTTDNLEMLRYEWDSFGDADARAA
jgi:hypothetical protein